LKILIVSYSGYGAWFSLRFEEEGHDVDYYLLDKKLVPVLEGIAPTPILSEPNFSNYDLVIFDLTGEPKLAENVMLEAPVIGDGNLATMLEEDRLFGLDTMSEVGINIPPYEQFDNIGEAKRFIKKTNKRYVFKPSGGQDQDTACTYVSESAEDLISYLDRLDDKAHGSAFILQEVVSGTEVSTEGWFNGDRFFLINGTLEEKKFMNDRKGPNTGCAGNLVWIYENEPAIFKQGLGLMEKFLREYNFHGMIDLNTIVSSNKLYGLEWTPRFGYDAAPTLFNLYSNDLAEFMQDIANGNVPSISTNKKFAASVRLSIPPYPTEVKGKHPDNIPIEGIDFEYTIRNCYLYDVMLDKRSELVTAGISGFICCPIGSGTTIGEAFEMVMEKIKHIKVPDMQYRTDIEKCCLDRYKILEAQGWLR
jgi:phosphoribosylamine---glycine ligase